MADIVLYHGTTAESAKHLLAHGWSPGSGTMGGNCGNPRYLYLTNEPLNAMWFAEEKSGDVVLEISVEIKHLLVDPEDGVCSTVEDELNSEIGLPGNVVLTRAIPASAIRRYEPTPALQP